MKVITLETCDEGNSASQSWAIQAYINGATIDGVYGYYITDSYPYMLACFKGTVDTSFQKHRR